MADAGALTALALSALFDLCVPGVSQGQLEQKFPMALVVPLTDREKADYADAIKGDDQALRIQSDAGFILLSTKGGFCRIITAEGDVSAAAALFRTKLHAAGGVERPIASPAPDGQQVDGFIGLKDGYAVALVFTAEKAGDSGFFASAFGVHKD
ncbi:MAG: hypothetical protein WDN08_17690 [Rhizomicrobium sp.]